jgi:hypothetical protein
MSDRFMEERLSAIDESIKQSRSKWEETWIEVGARIAVLEFLVAHLFRFHYLNVGSKDEDIRENHQEIVRLFEQYAYGGDPAVSDHISAEMTHWARETLNMVEELRAEYTKRGFPG